MLICYNTIEVEQWKKFGNLMEVIRLVIWDW